MNKMSWRFLMVAVLLLTFVACDRDDDDNDIPDMEQGTFVAAISGDIETDLQGVALYTEYQHQTTGEFFFVLGLGTTEGELYNVWFVRSGQFPGEGTYPIEAFDMQQMEEDEMWFFDVDQFVTFLLRQVENDNHLYFSEGGTITFELTDQQTIMGEFEFEASGTVFGEQDPGAAPMEILMSGQFHAIFGQVQVPQL